MPPHACPHELSCNTATSPTPEKLAIHGRVSSPVNCWPSRKLHLGGACVIAAATIVGAQRTSEQETSPFPFKRRRTVLSERNEIDDSFVQAVTLLDSQIAGSSSGQGVSFTGSSGGKNAVNFKFDTEKTSFRHNALRAAVMSPLKKRRPPKLAIPLGTSERMTQDLERGASEPSIEDIFVMNRYYCVPCKKGKRGTMEDVHAVSINLEGHSKQAFFGIFDGHGGRMAADYVAQNLLDNINLASANSQTVKGDIEKAVSVGYLTTDAEFLSRQVGSGASSVTAFFSDGYAVVANAGDCRAVLCRAGKAEALTIDHPAGREDEHERIEKLMSWGGYVDSFHGVWRVQGVLAVLRGFGDISLKNWICAEPDVRKLVINSECEFLILASDGLWDKVDNQEAVDCARQYLFPETDAIDTTCNLSSATQEQSEACIPSSTAKLLNALRIGEACKKLVEVSIKRGAQDDISVMIVDLHYFCVNGRV